VNVPIFDRDERLAGVGDLLEPKTGLVVESDGAGHREEVAHVKDNVREEKFEQLGLVVSRVGAIDHRNLPELSRRLAAARLHATLLEGKLLTAEGMKDLVEPEPLTDDEVDAEATYASVLEALNPLGLAYLHILESGAPELTAKLRAQWDGVLMLNPATPGSSTGPDQLLLIEDGSADLLSFRASWPILICRRGLPQAVRSIRRT